MAKKKRKYKLRTRAEAKKILKEYTKMERKFKNRVLKKYKVTYSHIQAWRARFKKEPKL